MRIWIAAAMLLTLGACQSSENSEAKAEDTAEPVTVASNRLSDAEKADGWQLLFDGNSKNGWHIYNNKTDGSAWVIDSGTIHLDPKAFDNWQTVGGGDLVTDSSYANFDLKLEWKIDTAANSGILFYIQEDSQHEFAYYTGPEMQVLDNARHPDAKIVKHRAGDLYDLITSSPEMVKPALEWNQVEIKSDNGHLEFFLNGTRVVETTMWDDNWKNMIAGSKFKEWPDFGTYKSGKIALQDHGGKVWYRNVKIRRL